MSDKKERKLTQKQEKFILKYFECGNATEAYKYAYNAKNMKAETIWVKTSKMLKEDKFRIRLNELRNAQEKRFEVSADDLVKRLAQIIFYDPLDIWDANGNVKPLDKIPKELRCLINGVKRKDTYGEVSSEEIEYKVACKDKALITLMKQKGMFDRTLKVEGEFNLKQILTEIEKEDND